MLFTAPNGQYLSYQKKRLPSNRETHQLGIERLRFNGIFLTLVNSRQLLTPLNSMPTIHRPTITLFSVLLCATTWGQIPEQKSINDYDQEVSQWMIAEATAETSSLHEIAVVELARLYGELSSDSRIRLSPTLNQFRVKVRARLIRVLRELEIRISRKLAPPDRTTSDRLQSTLERHLAATSRSSGGARVSL